MARPLQDGTYCLGLGESLTINLKAVIPLILTMLYLIIFDVVTPYMHLSIHYPSYFYKKKSQKNMFEKKHCLPLKLLL